MGYNSKSVQLGSLTIKYSPDSPITKEQQQRLSRALAIAQLVLRDGLKALDGLLRALALKASLDTVPPTLRSVLGYHIYQRGWPERPGQLRLDLTRLTNNLAQMRNGLASRVVIADVVPSKLREADDLMDLQRQLSGRIFSTAEVADRRWQAEVDAPRGFVKVKPKYYVGLTEQQKQDIDNKKLVNKSELADEWVPAVTFDPQQKSSIHINFLEMLHTDVSILRVARVLIHEASHKFSSTLDHAYVDQKEYHHLTARESLTNADSHAYAAVGAAFGINFKLDEQMQSAEDYRKFN
jgi:hypothetical protein